MKAILTLNFFNFRSSGSNYFPYILQSLMLVSFGFILFTLYIIFSPVLVLTESNSLNLFLESNIDIILTGISPYFITGLSEADSSFGISFHKDKKSKLGYFVGLRFKICLLEKDKILLELIKAYFKCGSISNVEKNGVINYIVYDNYSLNNIIIPHFKKYPLLGTKLLDFLDFESANKIVTSKKHLTLEGYNELRRIASLMNNYRKLDLMIKSELNPLNNFTNAYNDTLYLSLNGDYINGFIAGDGCINLVVSGKSFGSARLSISQHKNNYSLMKAFSNYFNLPNQPYKHGKESIQVQVNFKSKDFNLYEHFEKYPLYGVKSIQLEKLKFISQLFIDNNHLEQIGKVRTWKSGIKDKIVNIWKDNNCSLLPSGLPDSNKWNEYLK